MNFLVNKNGSSAPQYCFGTSLLTQQSPSSHHPLVCCPQGKDAEENGFSHDNLRLVTADLFAAGSETTSTTLRWAILYMLLHPKIQSKSAKHLQPSFFCSEIEHLFIVWGFCNEEQLW